MKLNSLIFGAFTGLLLLASCNKTEDPTSGEASLTLKSETVVTVDSKSQAVEIEFVTNRDWTAKSDAAWLQIDPPSGSASSDAQKVTVTVTPNDSYARTATITVSIGVTSKKVTLTQEGNGSAPDGTKDNPFDIASAIAKCQDVGETVSAEKYYIKGKISSIASVETSQYGNANFYMTEDGTESDAKFYAFQVYYLGNVKFTSADQIKVGDEVVVYGQIVNYKGNTPETNGKGSAYIYSLNGETSGDGGGEDAKTDPKGTGTEDDPFNAAAANAKCVEIGITASTEEYYVKGIISRIVSVDPSFGNATFYLSDDGSTTLDEFYVFRALSFNGEKFVSEDQIKVGDEVVVKGKLINYYGNTPEMNQGGQLVSVNGGQEVVSYLNVDCSVEEVSYESGSFEITVSSNVSWTVSTDVDFVILSPASGEGNGVVTVEYAANEDVNRSGERTVEIVFKSGDTLEKTVTFTQLAQGSTPFTLVEWKSSDWTTAGNDITLKKDGYTITVKKNNGSTAPAIRENNSIRAYAKATVEVSCETEMSAVEIILATGDGALTRYGEVTSDCGTVAAQSAEDTKVKWSGSSNKVVFTVGEKAIYGTDGADKAAQLRFEALRIR